MLFSLMILINDVFSNEIINYIKNKYYENEKV